MSNRFYLPHMHANIAQCFQTFDFIRSPFFPALVLAACVSGQPEKTETKTVCVDGILFKQGDAGHLGWLSDAQGNPMQCPERPKSKNEVSNETNGKVR